LWARTMNKGGHRKREAGGTGSGVKIYANLVGVQNQGVMTKKRRGGCGRDEPLLETSNTQQWDGKIKQKKAEELSSFCTGWGGTRIEKKTKTYKALTAWQHNENPKVDQATKGLAGDGTKGKRTDWSRRK